MKRFLLSVLLMLIATVVYAADPAAATAAPAPSTFQNVITWITTNQVVVGMLIAAILDFIFAINPEWQSNGALHMIYNIAKKKSDQTPPIS